MMNFRILRAGLALASAFSIAACSSSNTTPHTAPSGAVGLTARIVGVGDSLTAGVQSDGLLGASYANPITGSPFPVVPQTQGNGYFAQILVAAGVTTNPLDPATSTLPLMAPPGVGTQLVPTSTGGLSPVEAPCGSNNALAFSLSTALQTRANPTTKPYDLAVPGMTTHEVVAMTAPLGPCNTMLLPPAFQGLAQLTSSESLYFYPILGNFGANHTQLQDAVSLQPSLAIVNIGSNDILHYAFSNGAFPAPTAAALQTDINTIVTSLQNAGARVAIANLVDIMNTAQFTQVSNLQAVFAANGAGAFAPALASAVSGILLSSYGLGQNGYLTLTGLQKVSGAVSASLPAIEGNPGNAAAILAQALAAVPLTAGADYVSDAVATNAKALNAQYNTAIASVANAHGAALADVGAAYAAIEAAGGVYPVAGTTPACCSIAYGGGFFSLDGLHPTNTGYALIANVFIAAIDAKFGATIPAVSLATVNAADQFRPYQ